MRTAAKTFAASASLSRLAIVAVALLSVAACNSNKIKDEDFAKPAKLEKIAEAVKLQQNWATKIGNGQGKNLYLKLSPFHSDGSVYAAANNGEVVKLDSTTGERQWRVETRYAIGGGVAVDDDQLFFGSIDGDVVALAAADGRELWHSTIKGEVLSTPRSNGSVVVVHSSNGHVYGLRHDNGEQVWDFESQHPKLPNRGSAAPLMLGDEIAVLGLANGKLVALDIATGIMRWEQRVAIAQGRSDLDRIVDIEGTPTLGDSLIYAVSYQGNVVVVDAASGRMVWRKEASSYVATAYGFGNVYIAEADGKLSAYKVNDGNLQWQLEGLTYRDLSAPVPMDRFLLVGDFDGYLHLVSQVDGTISGRSRIDSSGVRAPMLALDEAVIAYSNKGRLVSYSLAE